MLKSFIRRNVIALLTWFDNSTNGFTATNVQAAIEEAKANAEGFPRAGIPLVSNGVVSNNQWISYSELTPDTKIVFPVKSKINEITWANTNLNCDFDLLFYKNGTGAGELFYTLQVRASNPGYGYVSGLAYTFAAGDYMKIKYVDQGQNASDFVLVPWVSRIV